MSLGDLKGFYYESTEDIDKNIFVLNFDYSKIVTPFSKIFKSYKPKDIYSGNENIPFKERDSEFKLILRHEFANSLKSY